MLLDWQKSYFVTKSAVLGTKRKVFGGLWELLMASFF
jgi:hypothetical protein